MLRYENENPKNFALCLKINLLQFSSASIYLFCLQRKPVRDNLMLSPFSDLKELISRNRFKTKTKPYETTEVYNSRIIKRRSSFSVSSFLQSMTSTLSTKRLWIFY